MIAINKKGASPAVYQTVETLQQPELQLIEEKIPAQTELGESELVLGVAVGVGVAVTLLVLLGVAVRHSSCGRAARGQSSLSLSLSLVQGATCPQNYISGFQRLLSK